MWSEGPCGEVCAKVLLGSSPDSRQTFPLSLAVRFSAQPKSGVCRWEPRACWDGVLHLCCPFALPLNSFHFSHEQTVSAWTNNPAILQSTPRLQYQTKGGPRGPAQAKECSFGVLLHKFNQHDKKEIIWAFVMIWKGEVCVPLIAVWPIARPQAWPTVEPYR